MKRKIYILLLLIIYSSVIHSQKLERTKSPRKAVILSAIIPGAGQIYTKKYWKIPIIYGGIIGSIYYINKSQSKYTLYKNTYLDRINGIANDNLLYTDNELRILKDHYRRNRELSYFSLISVYIINIIDASVNAHLLDFDISEDISLKITPSSSFNTSTMSLTVNF